MSLFAKAKKARENKKGFTLVELIVVLVILAILAAMMIPALLGWIDKAKEAKYAEEAHSIYMAIQALEDEKYAVKTSTSTGVTVLTGEGDLDYVNALVTPTKVTSAKIGLLSNTAGSHDAFTVSTLEIEFTSQNKETVKMKMAADGSWSVVKPASGS